MANWGNEGDIVRHVERTDMPALSTGRHVSQIQSGVMPPHSTWGTPALRAAGNLQIRLPRAGTAAGLLNSPS